MKNLINYYYNLNPDKINHYQNYYYFYLGGELYYFVAYHGNISDIDAIFKMNILMKENGILINEIINNQEGSIITYYNEIPYLLIKVVININKKITLSEIYYLSNKMIHYDRHLMRSNWANLWANKIDYLEYYHSQNHQKYPILSEYFDYFIGMSENAISYLNKAVFYLSPEDVDIGVISHDRILIEDSVYSIYDPLNIIIDHRARDVGEYIKISFFQDNYQIFDELDCYLKHNYFSLYGIHLLIARILYPSFYFEIYDFVVSMKRNEADVLKITSRIDEYEQYLADIFQYFKKYYPNIEEIEWIKKRGTNPHLPL